MLVIGARLVDGSINDEAIEQLNKGQNAQVIAVYETQATIHLYWVDVTIWITRNIAMEDGTQAITVMFPEEY